MILSPAARHSWICFTKCLQNRTRGQVRSFFLWWSIVAAADMLFPNSRSCSCKGCTLWLPVCYARLYHWIVSSSTSLSLCCLTQFFMYPVDSPKHIVPVPPSWTLPTTLASWMLCAETAVHASLRWNICFRSFLFSLCLKLMQCLQYMRQLTSRSSLMSNAFAIFPLPPILLSRLLQFSPIIQKIPCCFVLGAVLCTCNRPSLTASRTCFCLSFAAVSALQLSSPTLNSPPAFILLIISSKSWSCNRPCFLNQSALIHSCSIIDRCDVVFDFPLILRFFNFIHVDNNWWCLLAASFRWCPDARCSLVLCLGVVSPLDNPPCALLVPPLTDVEEGSVMTICPSAHLRLHQPNRRWQDHPILRWRLRDG